MKKSELRKIIRRVIRENKYSILNEFKNQRVKVCIASEDGMNSESCMNKSCGGLGGGCDGGCICQELIPTIDTIDSKDTGMLNERPKVGRCKKMTSPYDGVYIWDTCGGPCWKGRPCGGSGCDCWG